MFSLRSISGTGRAGVGVSPWRLARAGVFRAGVLLGVFVAVVLVGAAGAWASGPVWRVDSVAASSAAPGGSLSYFVQITNVGDAPSDGSEFDLVATLPSGMTGSAAHATQFGTTIGCTAGDGVSPVAGASVIKCSGTDTINPRGTTTVQVTVAVDPGATGTLTSSFSVSGGGAGLVHTVDPTRIAAAGVGFGVDGFDGQVSGVGGAPFTQAGGHQFDVSTRIRLNAGTKVLSPDYPPFFEFLSPWPEEPVRDINVDVPPGLTGFPTAVARCRSDQIAPHPEVFGSPAVTTCPSASQVGVLRVVEGNPFQPVSEAFAVYNMVPPPGVPARFAMNLAGPVVVLDGTVRSGSDYGLTVSAQNISEGLAVLGTDLTLWGVPADPAHDAERSCPGFLDPSGGGPSCATDQPRRAFLRLATSCPAAGEGAPWAMRTDSWTHPGVFQEAGFFSHLPPGFPEAPGVQQGTTGCDQVPFEPSLRVAPTSSAPDSPSGLNVSMSIPQSEDPGVIGQADLRSIAVRFPEGITINPSVAGGLDACTPAQIKLGSSEEPSCPGASRVGTVTVQTPALEQPLEGSLYVASQGANPFGSLLAVYLVAEGSGVVVKFPGNVEADPTTGRLTATFHDLPQQPVSEVTLTLKSGPRAPLVTPTGCGSAPVSSTLEGWNAKSVTITNPYNVDCTPGLGAFNPSFTAGTVNPQAGAYSPFTLSFSRQDGEQALSGIEQTLAPGLLAKLAGVPQCSDTDAANGSCPAASQIGTVTAMAGAGSDPISVQGKIYLTGPYNGGPFGEVVVIPAIAGPFNLGTVAVRGAIKIDPHTAQATVVSDPFPTILQGIPVQVRRVDVNLDRPGFTFNPTNCEPLSIPAVITSTQGTQAHVSSHFQAANCAALPFTPTFKVSTKATTSKKNGASLDVKVTSGAGQANLGKVAVTLPKQLPSWLPTIQQACLAAVFNQNPAACPAGSDIGVATATTPILANPVTGPVYLVSHGGAAFPDIVMVLQGEGVTVEQVGSINIKGQVTSSAFNSIPDVPISTFELNLPQGPHHALSTNLPAKAKGSFCGQSLIMPTTLTGQNGAQIKQSTKITVTGCTKTKAKKNKAKRKKHTTKAGGKKG